MLVRAARTVNTLALPFVMMTNAVPSRVGLSVGATSFSQNIMRHIMDRADRVRSHIRSLQVNGNQKNVNRCRPPGGNPGRGHGREPTRRT